jgi:hypothetical protein
MGTDSNLDLQQQRDGRRYVKAASNIWSKAGPKSQGPLADCPAFVATDHRPSPLRQALPTTTLVASHCCKRPY